MYIFMQLAAIANILHVYTPVFRNFQEKLVRVTPCIFFITWKIALDFLHVTCPFAKPVAASQVLLRRERILDVGPALGGLLVVVFNNVDGPRLKIWRWEMDGAFGD